MRIGIDLGGTKIAGILLDDLGRARAHGRARTPPGDYPATIAAIVHVVRDLERAGGRLASVGVGIPGTLSPATGYVKNANSTWLIGHPLDRDLEAALGRPVRIANDADCFAISEATDGAAAGAGVVFGVILGTGVGGGIVVNGRGVSGPNAIAGEWGHNPLPWADPTTEHPGPRCYCGHRGCIETFLSGPALSRDHAGADGESAIPPVEIVARAGAGDPRAMACIERYHHRLARALASVINILDPDAIVVGGGLSNIESLYKAVPRLWSRWVFSDTVATRIVRNRHGDASGVRGAAWLWPTRD